MLLDVRPINQPQRLALVGFFIVQLIRNPFFIEMAHAHFSSIAASLGLPDEIAEAAKFYESIYGNNEFYDVLSRSVMWSEWALVRAETPVFVLPDRFAAAGELGDGLRIIALITPQACFVTLPTREKEKRIVPHALTADPALAMRISALLVQTASSEFLGAPGVVLDDADDASFAAVLRDIAAAV